MSTTTQILFNSPALHSLKRDQLVKLCKIHSIKATGKNVDLINRLKQHASSLPPDAPLNIAVRSEAYDPDRESQSCSPVMPRPSEQWEVVMDDIDELPESSSSQNNVSSLLLADKTGTGEFGTAASKTSSVGSSIRALASSLSINRAMFSPTKAVSESDLAGRSTMSKPTMGDAPTTSVVLHDSLPESSLPNTDQYHWNSEAGQYDAPIPGNPLLPGVPAPSNARMSLTNPATSTTIRLVPTPLQSTHPFPTPPRLPPLNTSFDLVMGSPHSTAPKWPASPFKDSGLYPSLHIHAVPTSQEPEYEKMPGGLLASPSESVGTLPHSSSKPVIDVFSPTPPNLSPSSQPAKTENVQSLFSALRPEPFVFGSPLPQHRLSNHDFGKAAASVLEEMNTRVGLTGDNRITMDILTYKNQATREATRKEVIKEDKFGYDKAHEQAFNKMDSIASHYAVKRDGLVRKRAPPAEDDAVVPGTRKRKSEALGMVDGSHPPATKKASVAGANTTSPRNDNTIPGEDENDDDRRLSKRIRITDHDVRVKTDEEIVRKSRELEAVKRKAEARRRSSRIHGINTGLARHSIDTGTKGRTPLANGKNRVNKGSGSRFGFLYTARNLVKSVWNGVGTHAAKSATSSTVPPTKPLKPNPASRAVSSTSSKINTATTSQSSISSKVTKSTTQASSNSRGNGSRFGFGWVNNSVASSSTASKAGSSIGASSLGQKQKKTTNMAESIIRSGTASNACGSSKRHSSTLMAPTASSLAKMNSTRLPPGNRQDPRASLQVNSGMANDTKPVVSTNNHSLGTPARVFSDPLTTTTFSNPTKIPVSTSAKPVTDSGGGVSKPRSHVPRRPRISRARVIAKLGAQRVAANAGSVAKRSSVESGKLRSSMGNHVRKSYGMRTRTRGNSDVLLSAKRKARASEYSKRRSRGVQRKEVDVKMTDEQI